MGLLDQFFGDPSQTQALGVLGAGLMAGRPAQGFEQALGLLSPDAQLKRKLGQAQLDDTLQQIEMRKQQAAQLQRRNDMINAWMGQLDSSVPTANAAVAAQTGNLSPTIQNANLQSQQLQRLNAGNPIAGIPRSAITADLALNDGKNVPEWIFKRGTPDMQVSNGYAYDRNQLPPGFMPQLNISQNGQASLVTIGPDGLPQVSMPRGAALTTAQNTLASKLPEALITAAGTTNLRKGENGREYPVNALNENSVLMPLFQSVFGGQLGMSGASAPVAAPASASPQPASQLSPAPRGIQNMNSGLPLTPQLQSLIAADAKKNGITNPVVNLSSAEPGMPSSAGFQRPMIGIAPQGGAPSAAGGYGKTSAQEAADAAAAAYAKKGAEGMVDYENGLNSRVEQSAALNMRLQEQLAALNKFNAGGGGETRANLAQMAQAIGMPSSVVNKIAGGDLAAMQEFNKLAAQTAMEQLKQAMGGTGRVSQMEFQVFLHNNPNLSTDPDAIKKIFDFQNNLYKKDLAEQGALQDYKKTGRDITAFPAYWQGLQTQLGYTNPNFSAQAVPQNSQNLVSALPKNAKVGQRARDTQTNQILRFNGLQWVPEK
jgi:hypothetical protein